MSAARELFVSIGWVTPGDDVAHDKLWQAAQLWREEGQHFSAGMAMLRAVYAAWGRPDRMWAAQTAALQDFERVISAQAPDSPPSLAALFKLGQSLRHGSQLFDVDRKAIGTRVRELNSELAQRLLTHFGNSENCDNYLVRGFVIGHVRVADLSTGQIRSSTFFPHLLTSPGVPHRNIH